jgi:hypothetical protein
MSVAFYMDENAHGSITSGLRRRGVDVLTAQEDGRTGDPDESVLFRAGDLGRLVFTTDDDFLAIASERQSRGLPFVGVVYAHQHRLTIGDCVRELETIGHCSEPDEWRDKVTYLPL